MSRSFKKNPYISDNSVEYKKIAHRTTRRRIKEMDDILPSKGHYNKLYQSYYIHDYSPRWTKEDAILHYNEYISENSVTRKKFIKKQETLEEYLEYWAKCSYRK